MNFFIISIAFVCFHIIYPSSSDDPKNLQTHLNSTVPEEVVASEDSDDQKNPQTHFNRDMFFLKRKLFLSCQTCNSEQTRETLEKMPFALSQYEQSHAMKTTIANCSQHEEGTKIIDIFNQYGFIINGRQQSGQTNLMLASIKAAETCHFGVLNKMLSQGENPDIHNTSSGARISTMHIFDLMRREKDCPSCTREVYDILRKHSTAPSTVIELDIEAGVWHQQAKVSNLNQNPTGRNSQNDDYYGGGLFPSQTPTNQTSTKTHKRDNRKASTVWQWLKDKWQQITK
jgi:hypothetical protein